MADVEWIKLTVDMFDNRKIKYLRKLPEGNNIVLIWVMLLTMAGRCNANGMIFLTENIPYTTKTLADEIGFEENTVKLAIEALVQLNMVVVDGNLLTISGWQKYQNIEGMERIREQTRKRVAKHRESQKQKLIEAPKEDVTLPVTLRNAIDIDKEEEYINALKTAHCASQECAFFEELWQLYPRKKGKSKVTKKAMKAMAAIGKSKMTAAVKAYVKEVEGTDVKYIMYGSTFFNGGYEDYIRNEELPETTIPQLGHELR